MTLMRNVPKKSFLATMANDEKNLEILNKRSIIVIEKVKLLKQNYYVF